MLSSIYFNLTHEITKANKKLVENREFDESKKLM